MPLTKKGAAKVKNVTTKAFRKGTVKSAEKKR